MLATLLVIEFFFSQTISLTRPKLKARDYERFPNEISALARIVADLVLCVY